MTELKINGRAGQGRKGVGACHLHIQMPLWEDRITGEQAQSDKVSGDGLKSYEAWEHFQWSLFTGYR